MKSEVVDTSRPLQLTLPGPDGQHDVDLKKKSTQ